MIANFSRVDNMAVGSSCSAVQFGAKPYLIAAMAFNFCVFQFIIHTHTQTHTGTTTTTVATNTHTHMVESKH